ncbi:MAG: glycosyltransferase family 4 protein [Methanosarcinaceae archaeon]
MIKEIFHIITTLSSGGAEGMLYKLISHSSKNAFFKHSVVSLTGMGIYGMRLRDLGIPVYCLDMLPGILGFGGIAKLYRLLKKQRPQILHTWLYHSDLIGLIIGRLTSVPKILWNLRCSNVDFKYYAKTTRLIFAMLSRLSRFPDAVVINSEAGKLFHIKSGYNPQKWEVIPNGFDTERYKPNREIRAGFRKSLGLGESAYIVGIVARYDPIKDYLNFFEAAGTLSVAFPNVYFVIAGRGINKENDNLNKMILKNGLNKNAFLLGERDDLPEIIPAFDIGTLSSFSEGFPNVLGEYMSCGVPCVSTNVGDSSNIIHNTGIIVPPNNPEALAKAWLELLSITPEKRAKLGEKARKRIVEKFSISKVMEQYEKLYFEILQ